jgi:hypothetical protein
MEYESCGPEETHAARNRADVMQHVQRTTTYVEMVKETNTYIER